MANRFVFLVLQLSNVILMDELHEQLSIYNFEKHAKEETDGYFAFAVGTKIWSWNSEAGQQMKGGYPLWNCNF